MFIIHKIFLKENTLKLLLLKLDIKNMKDPQFYSHFIHYKIKKLLILIYLKNCLDSKILIIIIIILIKDFL